MEQLTKQILIRLDEADYELLAAKAREQKRPVAWIARESLKKGMTA